MATSPRSPLSPLTNMSQSSPANVQADGVDCGIANSSGDMSIEETVTIINELNTLLSKDDDFREIEALRSKHADIEALCSAQLLETKELIRQMASRATELENDLAPPPSAEERHAELQALTTAQANAKQQIATMESEIEAESAALAALAEARQNSEGVDAAAVAAYAESVPRVQHSVSLYATISGIRWDYSSEDKVCGVVNTANEVRAFELDPKTTSKYDITQALWDMIDPQAA